MIVLQPNLSKHSTAQAEQQAVQAGSGAPTTSRASASLSTTGQPFPAASARPRRRVPCQTSPRTRRIARRFLAACDVSAVDERAHSTTCLAHSTHCTAATTPRWCTPAGRGGAETEFLCLDLLSYLPDAVVPQAVATSALTRCRTTVGASRAEQRRGRARRRVSWRGDERRVVVQDAVPSMPQSTNVRAHRSGGLVPRLSRHAA